MYSEKFEAAIKVMRVAIIFSLEDEDQEVTSVPTIPFLDLIDESIDMERELKAIYTREKHYVDEKIWDEMIPWFDLTPNERVQAVNYWSA